MTTTTGTSPADAQEAPSGDVGLSEAQWADVAGTLAQEAAEAQHDATQTDDAASGETPTSWPDAFAPPTATTEPVADDAADEPRDRRTRERLRAAETDAEQLRSLVDSMRRAEVDRLSMARLADPGDLFRDGATMADMIGEDGNVDPARVDAAITKVVADHPHWQARLARFTGELRSGATSTPIEPQGKRFADAFAPNPEGRR